MNGLFSYFLRANSPQKLLTFPKEFYISSFLNHVILCVCLRRKQKKVAVYKFKVNKNKSRGKYTRKLILNDMQLFYS